MHQKTKQNVKRKTLIIHKTNITILQRKISVLKNRYNLGSSFVIEGV